MGSLKKMTLLFPMLTSVVLEDCAALADEDLVALEGCVRSPCVLDSNLYFVSVFSVFSGLVSLPVQAQPGPPDQHEGHNYTKRVASMPLVHPDLKQSESVYENAAPEKASVLFYRLLHAVFWVCV